MRITSVSHGKLNCMKMAKSIQSIKNINVGVAKRFRSLKKAAGDGSAAGGGGSGGRRAAALAIPESSSKWISTVRKKIQRPKFPHQKGSCSKNINNNNIIIIHNNTSIKSNELEDNINRGRCVEEVKEIDTLTCSLKEEEDVSVTSAAPPPNDQAIKEEEQTQVLTEIIRLREEKALLHIQSAFRGHLARRAVRALKSLVKLQAAVRGECVRRQTRMALHCMNTLVRLQVKVRARQLLSSPVTPLILNLSSLIPNP